MTKNEDTSLLRTRGYVDSILPPIPPKRYFTIGEVSELCAVKPHVLRYWEQEFPQLRPMKRRGNRRYYQQHEVLLIRKIRELLYDEGFTIQGARMRLTGRQTMANLPAEASALARGAAVGGTFGLLPDDAPEAEPEETDQTPAEAERAGRALAAAGSANKAQPEHGTPDQRPEAALHPSGAQAEADQAVAERHAPGTVLAHKAKVPGSAAKQASKPSAEQATGLASEQATGSEAWLWRLAFVVFTLFGGSGVLAYLLLWIFVPREPSF